MPPSPAPRSDSGPAPAGAAASRPELLAPAGDERSLRAALAAGADAVYLGLDRWSARAFADNFGDDELAAAIDRAHLFGARVHLTLNTLLKEGETDAALAALERPYLAGLDAVLVADLGLATAIADRYPGLELHASTQAGTHSSPQLALLARLGFRRAVLARELSLAEIAALDRHGLDLEVFVHGALCYGYSGACLFSSMVGGRSGNRGRCAQACRMRYRLRRADGRVGGGDRRASAGGAGGGADAVADTRVLSAADVAAVERLPDLLALGVRAFKIEGRMKDAGYVATAVSVYREALDAALADPEAYEVRPEWWERLEEGFSRTFTSAHLDGRHDEVRSAGRGGHRGVLVGRVESFDAPARTAVVRLSRPVDEGDLLTVYTSGGQTDPQRVEEPAATRVMLKTQRRVGARDRVFRTGSARLDGLARDAVAGRRIARPVPLSARFAGEAGGPAELTLTVAASAMGPAREVGDEAPAAAASRDEDRPSVTVPSQRPLETARTAALTAGKVRDAVGALGGTPYALAELDYGAAEGLFLPVGELKEMRRRAVAALDETRLAVSRRPAPRPAGASDRQAADVSERSTLRPPAAGEARGSGGRAVPAAQIAAAEPVVTVEAEGAAGEARSSATVLRLRPGEEPLSVPGGAAVCLEVDPDDEPSAVAAARAALVARGLAVRCRPPEILFDADLEWWSVLAGLPWEAVYARHAAHLATSSPVYLEYPLLGLSAGTVRALAAAGEGGRVAGLVLSPELTLVEIGALAAVLPNVASGLRLEVLAFGRQQVLVARDRLGLAEGLLDERMTADGAELELVDAKGYVFPVSVDRRGSRLFNARVTDLAGHLAALRQAGVSGFIVEQAALEREEADALVASGLEGLARFDLPERSTTAHLFRGIA